MNRHVVYYGVENKKYQNCAKYQNFLACLDFADGTFDKNKEK